MNLSFLRTVEAAKVQSSFRDALEANNINADTGAIAQFLAAVDKGGDAKEGQSLTIATNKLADGSETLSYEDTNGKLTTITAPKGTSAQIMAIWLGAPADSGVAKLKESLISGN